jgi:flagellar biosynthesis protein FlhF
MLVRKYRAKNLKEALGQVKADLGDGATILATRHVRAGLLRTQLEVTAALAPLDTPAARAPRPAPAALERPPAPPLSLEINQVARFLSPLRQELRALHTEVRALAAGRDVQGTEQVQGTLSELRELLHVLQAPAPDDVTLAPTLPPAPVIAAEPAAIVRLRERLQRTGMAPEQRTALLERVAARLPADAAEALACVDGLAASVIAGELRCTTPVELAGSPRVVALVGPAGVGKTTTLAKIAARAALVHGRRVAIIGCDTERIGALRALEDVARMVGIESRAARDEDALREALAELDDHELVLVDTSGHSVRDAEALTTLGRTLAGVGAEPCLLLNADLRAVELDVAVSAFAAVRPRALILTKVDQAIGLGGLYDAACLSGLPVMYLTNGRRIPEDISEVSPDGLASLVMGLHLN